MLNLLKGDQVRFDKIIVILGILRAMVLEYIDESYSQGGFYFFDEKGGNIGNSSSKNKIILKDVSLEESHCAIVHSKGCFLIKDLGSAVGTFIRVRNNVALQNGLFFSLGKTSFGVSKISLKVLKNVN
jgi:hypothetical protein